jgi:hypothetical protein
MAYYPQQTMQKLLNESAVKILHATIHAFFWQLALLNTHQQNSQSPEILMNRAVSHVITAHHYSRLITYEYFLPLYR